MANSSEPVARPACAGRHRWGNAAKPMHEHWLEERRICGADRNCLIDRVVAPIKALDNTRHDPPTWIPDASKRPN